MKRRDPAASVLLLAWLLPLVAACGGERGGAGAGAQRPPDVLLLTIDTLRADHLSAWGYVRPTSPTLDGMAAEGTRFAFAQAQRPKTGPSFTSMFTGGYCSDHGVRRIGQPAACSMRFLAEEMKELGYQTHAVVANAALARDFYFDQGFDTYIETWEVQPHEPGLDPTGAEAVTDLAAATVERMAEDRPFFLWVHYVDPHEPYTPPEPFKDLYQGDEHSGAPVVVPVSRRNTRQSWNGIGTKQVLEGRTDLPFYVARYDAEIRYVDAEIARLLDALRKRGFYDRMLTVMTSDHGESLGEHNYWFDHGMFGFQTCLHVPLVVRLPGLARRGLDTGPVELVDLAPTILEIAGKRLRGGTWRRGRSLLPRLRGESPPARPVAFAEAGYSSRDGWIRVATDGRFALHRLIDRADRRRVARADVEYALFDLAADPGETRDVAGLHAQDLARLRGALAAWEGDDPMPMGRDRFDCGDRAMESETEAQLRALGYL